jgi:hypothetical protein
MNGAMSGAFSGVLKKDKRTPTPDTWSHESKSIIIKLWD